MTRLFVAASLEGENWIKGAPQDQDRAARADSSQSSANQDQAGSHSSASPGQGNFTRSEAAARDEEGGHDVSKYMF